MVNGNCAVFNCANSQYRINKWKKQACLEHAGMLHGDCPCPQPFTLYTFPSIKLNSDKRSEWIRLINRTTKKNTPWTPGSSDVVCSEHFVDCRPTLENPNPVLKLGYDKPAKKPRRELKKFELAPKKSANQLAENQENIAPLAVMPIVIPEKEPCKECCGKEREIESLVEQIETLKLEKTELNETITNMTTEPVITQATKVKPKLQYFSIDTIKTDAKMKFYTGVQTIAIFGVVFELLKPFVANLNFWRGSKQAKKVVSTRIRKRKPQKITPKDQLLLVLMRLRLGLFTEDLADRFDISVGTCSSIFCTWVKLLSTVLGDALITWLPKETVFTNLPSMFREKHYKTRCIIDCTEINITRPKCLDIQAATWSDYKKHNTVKFLLAISPSGFIMFVSDCYGGRTSDRFICQDSNFYNHLEFGDVVMADRGFQIKEDLLHYYCNLSIPPGARAKDQMTPGECKKTKDVANLRIHVERAINRIKEFKMLKNTIPLTLLPIIDDIIRTCAAFCNMQSLLIKDKKTS